MRKLLSGVATLAFVSLLSIAPGIAAQAIVLNWPSDGVFVVGDAQWQFDEYGLASGWDVANNWNSDGYVYYPNEFIFNSESDYFLCGDSTTFSTDTEVTSSSSGTINLLCPETPVPGYPNLSAQIRFSIYPESSSGYLVRQDVAIINSSDNYETIPDLTLINYPNLHADYSQGQYLGHEEAEWFVDSVNTPFTGWLWQDASYYSQGMGNGSAVALSNAWSRPGQANISHYVTVQDQNTFNGDPYLGSGSRLRTNVPNFFAAKSTTHLLTFTNMVLPTAVSPAAGAIAKAASLAQTSEFSTFDGRLIEGLPDCTTYAGWGTTPGDCAFSSSTSGSGSSSGGSTPQPCIAALAETGFNFFVSLLGGLSAAAVGVWLMYQSRKSPRVKGGRIRQILFPER